MAACERYVEERSVARSVLDTVSFAVLQGTLLKSRAMLASRGTTVLQGKRSGPFLQA